jgi:hypothetical protein
MRGKPSIFGGMTPERRANRQPVLIPAGTPITSEKGHRVCTTAVDLQVNELLAVEMFTNWQIAAPRAGDMFPRCGICGAAAHRESRDGVTLHTPEGWR